ncbi:MAG TPA: hypothetical protein VHW09_01185 [Bryobacteraceae bacterium]|jgi:probable HAF family extracellular repeat protein|nr:hypothetical protein [Bryobacteraceae bacterium]
MLDFHLRLKSCLFIAASVLLGLPSKSTAQGYTITTVAGDGILGYAGDNGSAVRAEIWALSGVSLDYSGNILIADTGNCRIRKVTKGIITTIAGNGVCAYTGDGGPATQAELSYPRSVAADAAGNVYITDTGNARVRKIDTNGNMSTIAGTGTQGYSGDGGPSTAAQVYDPWSIAVDLSGDVLFVDRSNQRIREITPDGTINTVAGNGQQGYSGDGGPATSASLYVPSAVAVDFAGNFYVVESQSATVRKVNTAGIIQTVAGTGTGFGFGGDGGPATAALLNDPQGAAIDPAGNIFIADEDNQRLREVTTDGIMHTIAGSGKANYSGDGGPSTGSILDLPEGVGSSPGGTIYFVDSGNRRIRALTANSIETGTPCAVNSLAATPIGDAQALVNEALGIAMAIDDLNLDGEVNVTDLQILQNAALGLGCSVPVPLHVTTSSLLAPFFSTASEANRHTVAANGKGESVGFRKLDNSTSVHAFVYRGGEAADLGTLGGGNSAAVALNSAGQIVGSAQTARGAWHAFLFTAGAMMDLGTLGGPESGAKAIDSRGFVAGWAMTITGEKHAFLWRSGQMIDLNDLTTVSTGAVLVEVVSFGDRGEIVARGADGRAYRIALTQEHAAVEPPTYRPEERE